MTLKELIARTKGEIFALIESRNAKASELAEIRSAETVDTEREAAVRAEVVAFDEQIASKRATVAQYEAEDAADAAAAEIAEQVREAAPSPSEHRSPTTVTSEPRTYRPENERSFDRSRGEFRRSPSGQPIAAGGDFARDVASAFLGNFEARARLERHMQEERVERGEYLARAVGTGAFAGLTVPQYLTDLYAPAVAAGRPFANICRPLPLPAEGMTVNLSRITTSTSVDAQASQNTAVDETDADDTLLTESVLTAAGQQTMSRQAIDRSTGAEVVIMDDLFRRYGTDIDDSLLNDATTGLTNVAQSVAYTDASPTAAEAYPKLLNAQSNLETVYLDQQVQREFAIMHPRRWRWLQSQVGTSWPFIAQPGIPTQAGGVNNGDPYGGVRGTLPNGMQVVCDGNVATNLGAGTNEDEIYVVNADECFLWEDPNAPMFIRAEQPAAASLGVLLVVYGYYAYTHRRYTNGQQKIAGTGLVTPTF